MFASAYEYTLRAIISHAPHEQGVIRVLENLSQVVLEMTRATIVVLANVSKV